MYVNTMVDLKDFKDTSLHYYIEEPISISLATDKLKTMSLYLQKSTTEFLDDVFMMWVKTENDFS